MRTIAIAGRVAGHDLLILPGRVILDPNGADPDRRTVPNFGTDVFELAQRPGFRIASGRFPDGCEVIYLYDRDDGGFGYAPITNAEED